MKVLRRALLVSATGVGLAFAACGDSEEDTAKGQICDARDDIQAQVSDIKQLTLTTATTDQIKSHLSAIKDDISTIGDARGELTDKQQQQLQKANDTFKSQLDTLIRNLGTSVSLQDAAAQLKVHITDLAESYEMALSPIDC